MKEVIVCILALAGVLLIVTPIVWIGFVFHPAVGILFIGICVLLIASCIWGN